jgi:hypothetical protein
VERNDPKVIRLRKHIEQTLRASDYFPYATQYKVTVDCPRLEESSITIEIEEDKAIALMAMTGSGTLANWEREITASYIRWLLKYADVQKFQWSSVSGSVIMMSRGETGKVLYSCSGSNIYMKLTDQIQWSPNRFAH